MLKEFMSYVRQWINPNEKTTPDSEKVRTPAPRPAASGGGPGRQTRGADPAGREKKKKKSGPRTPPPPPVKKKWDAASFDVPPKKGETRFHDFNLPLPLMRAVADLNFRYCTKIQAELLPHTLDGRDAMAKAQTGTGKSATFIITIISDFLKHPLKLKNGMPRALILAPTRELVHQIEKDFKALASHTRLKIAAVYGGTAYKQQQAMLRERPFDAIVATPGRLIDFIEKRLIHPAKVQIMVIDEADRMLDMGFIQDVRRIVLLTPHKNQRQTMFYSATLSAEVLRLARSWTRKDAVKVEIDPDQAAAQSIHQIVYLTTEDDKFKNIYNLMIRGNLERVLIFVNRKDTARDLCARLIRYGGNCSVLSGDVSQDKRFKVLNRFKKGDLPFLVATDVAARGLHIENISHVINYDLPYEPEHYIHRIGRTGRAGATGTSVSFADETSSFFIPDIEKVLGNKLLCEYPSRALELPLPKPVKKAVQKQRPPAGRASGGLGQDPGGGGGPDRRHIENERGETLFFTRPGVRLDTPS